MIDALPQVKTGFGLNMQNHAEISLADQYTAALEWWRGAGVDYEFEDEAQNWLADPNEPKAALKPLAPPSANADAKPAEPSIVADDLPTDLAAFQVWWRDPESPLPKGPGARIGPRGAVGAKLMVIVPMPEADDREALLSGPHGRLLSNIAKAMGVHEESLYFASALPSHMPLPDWPALSRDGLGVALNRHVALAQPERVLLLGSKLPQLFGHDPDQAPEKLATIGDVSTLATFAPERLLDHPRQRARLWNRLLQWTAQ